MINFQVRHRNGVLAPASPEAIEIIRALPEGKEVSCSIRRPRSHRHHRKYWALCRLVASNHEQLKNEKMVDQVIKIESGHVDLVKVGGAYYKLPRSISFSAMDQDGFNEFYNRACDVVCDKLLPGVDREEVQEQLLGFM